MNIKFYNKYLNKSFSKEIEAERLAFFIDLLCIMKDSGVNTLYFTTLTIVGVVALVSMFYPYPPELLERIKGTWEWSDMPTPRLLHCLKIIFISFICHCVVHFLCRCCFKLFFERYYTLPWPERITLSEKYVTLSDFCF